MGACAEPQFADRHFECLLAGRAQSTQRADLTGGDVGVVMTTRQLPLAGCQHALSHPGGRLAAGLAAELLVGHGGDFDVEIDTVQQRAADFGQVALDDTGCAAALAGGVAMEAARAPVQISTALVNRCVDRL